MNWLNRSTKFQHAPQDLLDSILYDEATFYKQFSRDLSAVSREVIIESPFITSARMRTLRSIFEKLINRGIKVYIFTRDPREHDEEYERQSEAEIRYFEEIGVQVFLCLGNHHRKLAILDRQILWEGSLNILSQIKSREIMRRIDSNALSEGMFNFLRYGKWIY